MRKKLCVTLCMLTLCLSACGQQELKESENSTNNQQSEVETQKPKENTESPTEKGDQAEANSDNSMGSSSETPRLQQSEDGGQDAEEMQELSYEEMAARFFQKFYGVSNGDYPSDDVLEGHRGYFQKTKYASDMNYYFEQILGVTDVSNFIYPLFYTDMKYYTAEDFENLPPTVIHIAKNEIYAKHGYIFKDQDLQNYFMSCAWYKPLVTSKEFDDSVFNQYEVANLKLLSELDK